MWSARQLAQDPKSAVLAAVVAVVAVAGIVSVHSGPTSPFHHGLGPISWHMVSHIVIMALLAPAAVALFPRSGTDGRVGTVWLAAALQLVILGSWHLPFALWLSHSSALAQMLMSLCLLASASWFWLSVAAAASRHFAAAIAALLVTGKILCLLGLLLALMPVPLFREAAGHLHLAYDPLADQRMAAVIMLVACPVAYVGASIVIGLRAMRLVIGQER